MYHPNTNVICWSIFCTVPINSIFGIIIRKLFSKAINRSNLKALYFCSTHLGGEESGSAVKYFRYSNGWYSDNHCTPLFQVMTWKLGECKLWWMDVNCFMDSLHYSYHLNTGLVWYSRGSNSEHSNSESIWLPNFWPFEYWTFHASLDHFI